ncbi:MAG: penicillin acylase family protein [Acidobacteriota bacterium]
MEELIGFSRAVRVGNIISVAGTAAIAPNGSTACPDDVYGQAKCCFGIMKTAIEEAGGRLEDVIRARIMLKDISRWEEAAKASGGDLAKEAAAVLEAWDRKAEADSRGMVLFSLWALEMDERLGVVPQRGRPSAFAKPWDPKDPLATPSRLADPAAAVEVLVKIAAQVKSIFGSVDVPFGDAARFRRGGFDFPPNGGPGRIGFFRAVEYSFSNRDKKFLANGGDSYVCAVEFSSPVRAKAVLGYGNASQPGSPHNGDQMTLVSRKEMRPVWRTRQDVEAHLEFRIEIK